MGGEEHTNVEGHSDNAEELLENPEDKRRARKKDGWDKADVILKALIPVSVFLVGLLISHSFDKTKRAQEDYRIYTELMSNREQAESALRKDMFKSIIGAFLGADKDKLGFEDQVVNLELLAYNFHESLNLKPLFQNLVKQIEQRTHGNNCGENRVKREVRDGETISCDQKREYLNRLKKVAEEITRQQLMVLRRNQNSEHFSISLKEVPDNEEGTAFVLKKVVAKEGDKESPERRVFEFEVGNEKRIKRICEARSGCKTS